MKSIQKPELRKFPYPYRAALSICSDIDGTDSVKKYLEIFSFLSQRIGIKFSSSFFPFYEKNGFAWFSGNEKDKVAIVEQIHKGNIDAIHSYGEKAGFSRKDAERTINELKANNCRINVWVDHSISNSNLCKYRFLGKGDIPGEKEYHFDLTKAYGIKYIWTERLTNIIGQDRSLNPWDLAYIFNAGHPFLSIVAMAKTIAKIFFDILGYKKYDYFLNNVLVKITQTRDQQSVYEFIRFNNSYDIKKGDTFEDLPYLISEKVIQRLRKVEGYIIFYIHLGKKFNLNSPHGKKAVMSLLKLKKEQENGNIYIDSTKNILDYYIKSKYLDWHYKYENDIVSILIKGINDPIFGFRPLDNNELNSLTFYHDTNTKIYHEDKEVINLKHNPPDYTGRKSISLL